MKNSKRNPFSLEWSTIVPPTDYNIEADMQQAVRLANSQALLYVPMDIGKIIGLYEDWKRVNSE